MMMMMMKPLLRLHWYPGPECVEFKPYPGLSFVLSTNLARIKDKNTERLFSAYF